MVKKYGKYGIVINAPGGEKIDFKSMSKEEITRDT